MGSLYLYVLHRRSAIINVLIDAPVQNRGLSSRRLNLPENSVTRTCTWCDTIRETYTRVRSARTHFTRVECFNFMKDLYRTLRA